VKSKADQLYIHLQEQIPVKSLHCGGPCDNDGCDETNCVNSGRYCLFYRNCWCDLFNKMTSGVNVGKLNERNRRCKDCLKFFGRDRGEKNGS